MIWGYHYFRKHPYIAILVNLAIFQFQASFSSRELCAVDLNIKSPHEEPGTSGNLWALWCWWQIPTEIAARRMDWWEHVRRCRRRAQARPVTWPRKWHPGCESYQKTFKIVQTLFPWLHPISLLTDSGAFPFSFGFVASTIYPIQGSWLSCCFWEGREQENQVELSIAVLFRHVWRVPSSRWLQWLPIAYWVESEVCSNSSISHSDLPILQWSCYTDQNISLVQVKAVLRRRGTSAKQLFALQATFHC